MSPTIRIDEDVYEALKNRAEPFTDTPNSVLREVLGLATASDTGNSETTAGERPPAREGGAGLRSPQRSRSTRSKKVRKEEKRSRAATGTILRGEEYEAPILESLVARRGRAPSAEVMEELGERLHGKLMDKDHEVLDSGQVRWRNRAQFVRLRLVERGDMVKGSPRGIWEITEQGRQRVNG